MAGIAVLTQEELIPEEKRDCSHQDGFAVHRG